MPNIDLNTLLKADRFKLADLSTNYNDRINGIPVGEIAKALMKLQDLYYSVKNLFSNISMLENARRLLEFSKTREAETLEKAGIDVKTYLTGLAVKLVSDAYFNTFNPSFGKAQVSNLQYYKSLVNQYRDVLESTNTYQAYIDTITMIEEQDKINKVLEELKSEALKDKPDIDKMKKLLDENKTILEKHGIYNQLKEGVDSLELTIKVNEEIDKTIQELKNQGYSGITRENLDSFRKAIEEAEKGNYTLLRTIGSSITYKGIPMNKYADYLEYVKANNDKLKKAFQTLASVMDNKPVDPKDLDEMVLVIKDMSSESHLTTLALTSNLPAEELKAVADNLDTILQYYVLSQGENGLKYKQVLDKHGVKTDVLNTIEDLRKTKTLDEAIEVALKIQDADKNILTNALIHDYVIPLIDKKDFDKAYQYLLKIERVSKTRELEDLKKYVWLNLNLKRLTTTIHDTIKSSFQGALSPTTYSITLKELEQAISESDGEVKNYLLDLKTLLNLSYAFNSVRLSLIKKLEELNKALEFKDYNASSEALKTIADSLDQEANNFKNTFSNISFNTREISEYYNNIKSMIDDVISDVYALSGTARTISTLSKTIGELYKTIEATSEQAGTPQGKQAMITATTNLLEALRSVSEYASSLKDTDLQKNLKTTLMEVYNEVYKALNNMFTTLCKNVSASYCEVGDKVNEAYPIKIQFEKPPAIAKEFWGTVSAIHDANKVFLQSSFTVLRKSKSPIDVIMANLGVSIGVLGGFGTGILLFFRPDKLVEGFTTGARQIGEALAKTITGRGGEVVEGVKKWAGETYSVITRTPESTLWYTSVMAGQVFGAIATAKLVGWGIGKAGSVVKWLPKYKDYFINLAQGDPYGLTLVFIKDASKGVYKVLTSPTTRDLLNIAGRMRGEALTNVDDISKFISRFKEDIRNNINQLSKLKTYNEIDISSAEFVSRVRDYTILSKIKNISIDNYEPTRPEAFQQVRELAGIVKELKKHVSEEAVKTTASKQAGITSYIDELTYIANKYKPESIEAKFIRDLKEFYNTVKLDVEPEKISTSSIRAKLESAIPMLDEMTKYLQDPSTPPFIKDIARELLMLKGEFTSLMEQLKNATSIDDPSVRSLIKKSLMTNIDDLYGKIVNTLKEGFTTTAKRLTSELVKTPELKNVAEILNTGIVRIEKIAMNLGDIKEEVYNILTKIDDMIDEKLYPDIKKSLKEVISEVEKEKAITDLRHIQKAVKIVQNMPEPEEANKLSTILYLETHTELLNKILTRASDPNIGYTFIQDSLIPALNEMIEYLDIKVKTPAQLINKLTLYCETIESVNNVSAELIRKIISEISGKTELSGEEVKELVKILNETASMPSKSMLKAYSTVLRDLTEGIDLGDVKLTDGYRRLLLQLSNATEKIAYNIEDVSKGFGFYVLETSKGRFYTNINDPKLIEYVIDLKTNPIKKTKLFLYNIGELELTRRFTESRIAGLKALEYEIKFPDGGIGKIVNYVIVEPPSWWRKLAKTISDSTYKLYLKYKGLDKLYAKEWEFNLGTIYFFDPVSSVKLVSAFGDIDNAVSKIIEAMPELETATKLSVIPDTSPVDVLKTGLSIGLYTGLAIYTSINIAKNTPIDTIEERLKQYTPSIPLKDIKKIIEIGRKFAPDIKNNMIPYSNIIPLIMPLVSPKTVQHLQQIQLTKQIQLQTAQVSPALSGVPPEALLIPIPFDTAPFIEYDRTIREVEKEVNKKVMREKLELFT